MKTTITTRKIKMRKSRKNKGKKYNGGKWSLKYKRSIDCKHPRGFSQKQHCKYGIKMMM
jgi:hypothetical protein